MAPPNIPLQYTLIYISNENSAENQKVIGIITAMAMVADAPGNAPTIIPIMVPIKMASIEEPDNRTFKPSTMLLNSNKYVPPFYQIGHQLGIGRGT